MEQKRHKKYENDQLRLLVGMLCGLLHFYCVMLQKRGVMLLPIMNSCKNRKRMVHSVAIRVQTQVRENLF